MFGQLRVCEAAKRYGNTHALKDFSYRFSPPERVFGVIGPNGSGKTTLLNVISGASKLDAGSIELDNARISDWDMDRRARSGIRRLFQEGRVFERLTVERNLEVALLGPVQSTNIGVFRDAGSLSDALGSDGASRRNEFLDLFLLADVRGQLAAAVSFGQRKLLALAMACIRPFQVVLLDEPVAGLHPHLIDHVTTIVRGLDGTIIVVEHNMEFLKKLDCYVLFMDQGELVAQGTLTDVLASAAAQRAYS